MKKGKEPVRYRLELTETQLMVLQNATEEYFRIRMNQWQDLADSLAFHGTTLETRKSQFDFLIEKRNHIHEIFKCVGRIVWPDYTSKRQDDECIASDIWSVIRHARYVQRVREGEPEQPWCTAHQMPFQMGSEPLPICEVIDQKIKK